MSVSIKTEYIDVPGGFVSLDVYGQNDDAIPLLYIHGGPGGNCESFKPMAEMLAKDRKVYLYNQLGSDDSSHTGEESLWVPERYIEALSVLIKNLNLKKLHLLGRSWGAMLAAEHVLRTPDSPVISITMMSPFLKTELWISDAKLRLAEMGGDYLKTVEECEGKTYFDGQLYQETITEYNKLYQCRTDSIAADSRLLKYVVPKTVSGMKVYKHMWGPGEFTCTGILKDMDLTGKIPQIKICVLLLCGEYDQVRQQTCEYYRSLIPGSRMAIIPNASQTQFLENPNVFYWTLTNFLNTF